MKQLIAVIEDEEALGLMLKYNLEKEGFQFYTAQTLPEKYIPALKELFSTKYSLMLTPMAIDPSHPFPFITGKTLNLLVRLFSDKQPDLPLHQM